jgi:cell division protein YceG involved in septum cleavage
MEANMNSQREKGKLTKRKKLLLALLILLLIIIGLVSFFITGAARANGGSPSPSSQSNPGSSSLVNNGSALPGGYTPKSRQEILSELQKEQVVVTDKVSAQISFPSGAKGAVGSWVVENPATNKVIEQCDVVLNGKTVAESVPINPGQHIESITLSQKVAPGTYDVTATINYYSTSTKELLGKAGYRIKLTVS